MNETIETSTTTKLESLEKIYQGCDFWSSVLTTWEKSAILKGIRAELIERKSEVKFLKKERGCIHDAEEIERLSAQCVEYLEKIDGLEVAIEDMERETARLDQEAA